MNNKKLKITRQAEEIKRLNGIISKHDEEIEKKSEERMIDFMRSIVQDYDKGQLDLIER